MARVVKAGQRTTVKLGGEELLTAKYPLQPDITFGALVAELARQKLNLQNESVIKVEFQNGEFIVTFNPTLGVEL